MGKRGATIIIIAILCLSSCLWVQAKDGATEIPIVIKERAGLDWKNIPLTVGVPVPAGDGGFSAPPRVLDQWGREVASQAVLLSKPTATAVPQWWRITFFGTINRNDSLVYRVVPGEEKRVLPRAVVEVEKTAAGYLVTNNRLKLELSADQPLIAKAWFDPNGRGNFNDETPLLAAPCALGLKTSVGQFTTDSASLTRITLEESGPLRAVFRINGLMPLDGADGPFTYDCRLIVYAETAFIRLELRLINTTGQPVNMEEAWVRAAFDLKSDRLDTAFGVEGKTPKTATLRTNGRAQVQIDSANRIRWGGVFSASGDSASGWANLAGAEGSVNIGVKAFRQQYPKGLQVSGKGEMNVQLLPASSGVVWDPGVAKTHHITMSFHSTRDRESIQYIEAVTNKPPVAMPAPDWVNQTGVLPQPLLTSGLMAELSPDLQGTALLLKEKNWSDLLNLFGPTTGGQEINQDYWGFFNYGDLPLAFSVPWAQQGQYWNNNVYDLPFQLLCAYLQSEDPALLEIGEAALTHWQDVDLVNPTANPRPFPGLDHLKDPRRGEVGEAEDFRHFENRGLMLGYYLLDDQFGYELALRMADRVTFQAGVDLKDLRTIGSGLMAVLTAYQATGGKRYLDCATELVELVLAWQQQQEGGLPADFIYKAGLVTDSLVAYYRLTKDPRVLTAIQAAVDHALYHFWDEEAGLIQNTGGLLFTSALDLLYWETGTEDYYKVSEKQVNYLARGSAGNQPKDVALTYRTLFSFFNGARLRHNKK